MALSPEDVLNKTFTTTQFRRGYDEREVDDFLDELFGGDPQACGTDPPDGTKVFPGTTVVVEASNSC